MVSFARIKKVMQKNLVFDKFIAPPMDDYSFPFFFLCLLLDAYLKEVCIYQFFRLPYSFSEVPFSHSAAAYCHLAVFHGGVTQIAIVL